MIFVNIPTEQNNDWDAATANWSANGYRLPTEMEWMWAAMVAVDDYTKSFAGSNGYNSIGDYAWYNDNSSTTTHQLGSKNANELGLYDMSGNVWELNWDRYESPYPSGTLTDYRGEGEEPNTPRVIRGGSWFANVSCCAVDYQHNIIQYDEVNNVGFRVVCH